jgi:hypothetical protein
VLSKNGENSEKWLGAFCGDISISSAFPPQLGRFIHAYQICKTVKLCLNSVEFEEFFAPSVARHRIPTEFNHGALYLDS